MALIRALTFESGSLTGSDAFDSVSGSYNTIESTDPTVGSYAYRSGPNTGGVNVSYGEVTWTNAQPLAVAAYWTPLALPNDTAYILWFGTTLNRGSVRWRADGKLELYNTSSNLVGTSTDAVTLGQTYRLEVLQTTSETSLWIAEGDGASTLVASGAGTTAFKGILRVGVSTSTRTGFDMVWDEIHIRDDDTMPTLPALPAGSIELPARGGLVVGGRADLTVTKTIQPRGGLVVGGRADLTVKTPLPARGGLILGGRATITAGSILVEPRGGLVVGGRVALTPTRQIPARGGLVIGGRVALSVDDGNVEVQPRGGLVVGGRVTLTVTVPLEARGGLVVGGRAHLTVTHTLKVRGGIVLGGRDAYTGTGSGIVVQGVRFNPNDIREGDSFNVYLPWAGIEGLGTLAHVKSRTISDQMAEQDLSLQVVPQPDPKLVPSMAGGGRPGLKPLRSDVARKAARAQREIDRLERNRE